MVRCPGDVQIEPAGRKKHEGEQNMKKMCLAVFFAVVLGWVFQPPVHAQSSDPQFQQLLSMIGGIRYSTPYQDGKLVIDVRGSVLSNGGIDSGGRYYHYSDYKITGRETTIVVASPSGGLPQLVVVKLTYIISENGDRITNKAWYLDGHMDEYTFRPER
jgi:hypothetical protein